jgi:hypothetical protein
MTNEDQISVGKCIRLAEEFIKGLEKKCLFLRKILCVRTKHKRGFEKIRPKCLKKSTLQDMFKNIENTYAEKNDNSVSHCST